MSHAPSQALLAELRALSDLLRTPEGDCVRPSPPLVAALSAFEAKAREWIRSIEAAETEKRFLGAHPRARHYADELRGDRERLLTEIGDRIAQTREGNPDHTRIADLIRAWTHHVESIARIEARASN